MRANELIVEFRKNPSVWSVEGNGIRPSHLGVGISDENAPMYTLNTTEIHAVMMEEDDGHMDIESGRGDTCRRTHLQKPLPYVEGSLQRQQSASRDSGGGGQREHIYLESHPNDSRIGIEDSEASQTLSSRMGTGGGNTPMTMEDKMGHYVVRRITPRECERLQGFPSFPEAPRDHTDIGEWTDKKGKKRVTTDAARYKALGNSMAVPCMRWIAQRIDWALANPITEDTSEPLDWQPDLF